MRWPSLTPEEEETRPGRGSVGKLSCRALCSLRCSAACLCTPTGRS